MADLRDYLEDYNFESQLSQINGQNGRVEATPRAQSSLLVARNDALYSSLNMNSQKLNNQKFDISQSASGLTMIAGMQGGPGERRDSSLGTSL